MNTQLTTTGLLPLTIGSSEVFEASADLNAIPWSLLGGTVTLKLVDPNGNVTTLSAAVGPTGYSASASWTVAGPAGIWVRAWTLVDSSGRVQVSRQIVFSVISSPI
jgi:hypothetical protein